MSRAPAIMIEAVQFVPLLSFAAPFVLAGQVDLSAAGGSFLLGAALAIPIAGALAWKKIPQNPILLGVDAWLAVGALAFAAVPPLAELYARYQAATLFVGAFVVGVALTALSPGGYLGMHPPRPDVVRKGSAALLALTAGAVAWALVFPDIRLGGAVPFIALNVVRRVALRRLSGG
jgi:hypothetical protein